jgi:amino acid transporter
MADAGDGGGGGGVGGGGASGGAGKQPSPPPSGSAPPPPHPARVKSLGVLGLFSICFFLTSGGPSGLELAVLYAGPYYVFLGFATLPLLWGLPQALITAELATALPENGGPVLWLREAGGDLGAWLVGLNGVVSSMMDLALYPLLVRDYVGDAFGGGGGLRGGRAVALGVIALGVALNVRGLGVVSRASTALTLFVLAPYAVAFVVQLPGTLAGGGAWAQTAERPNWPLFAASMLWSFSGYDATGSFAGEVRDPSTTYVRGMLLTLAAAAAGYALPLLTAIQAHPRYEGWRNGVLQQFVGEDVHPALGSAASVGAVLAHVGMFTAGLSASARAMAALAGGSGGGGGGGGGESGGAPAPGGGGGGSGGGSGSGGGGGGGGMVAHLPLALAGEWRGVPLPSLALHALVVAVLTWRAPFSELIQINLLLGALRILLISAAFLRLRAARPDLPRPYRVPGGWCGALTASLPLLLVSGWFASIAERAAVVPVLALNVAGLLVFGLRAWRDRRRAGVWWPRGACNLVPSAPGGGGGGGAWLHRALARRRDSAQPEPDDARLRGASSDDDGDDGSGSGGYDRVDREVVAAGALLLRAHRAAAYAGMAANASPGRHAGGLAWVVDSGGQAASGGGGGGGGGGTGGSSGSARGDGGPLPLGSIPRSRLSSMDALNAKLRAS